MLNKKQRERRDELAATGAVGMAAENKLRATIAVDDMPRVRRMVRRVERIAQSRGLSHSASEDADGVLITLTNEHGAAGSVYVLAAESLIHPSRRPN